MKAKPIFDYVEKSKDERWTCCYAGGVAWSSF